MKTAAIYLHGIPAIDKPTGIKTVKYETEDQLKKHLLEMQMGYWEEGDKKPKVVTHTNPKGKKLLICEAETDFHYVAWIGLRFKESANKPVETIY